MAKAMQLVALLAVCQRQIKVWMQLPRDNLKEW